MCEENFKTLYHYDSQNSIQKPNKRHFIMVYFKKHNQNNSPSIFKCNLLKNEKFFAFFEITSRFIVNLFIRCNKNSNLW